jgi:hypothetical protein
VIHSRGLGYDVAGLIGHSKGASICVHYSSIYKDVPLYILISGTYKGGLKNFIRRSYPDMTRFRKLEF